MLNVWVAYASPTLQCEMSLTVEPSCTVAMAIRRSGLLDQCPSLSMATLVVGVYGKRVALDALLSEGDRIEIYRPLQCDPMTARRRRVNRS